MASPVFSRSSEFKPQEVTYANSGAHAGAETQSQLNQPTIPGVTGTGSDTMSYEGVIAKTASIGILMVVVAAFGYMVPNTAALIGSGVVGFVLALVIIFQKKANPVLIGIYALAEGYFLGAITIWIEQFYDVPGAGLQALAATGITFGVCLALYRSGKVRYTKKMQKFLIIGGISYAVFGLINIGYMIFSDSTSGFGLREDLSIAGVPLGVIIGAVAIFMACISLIGDFDFIENGVKNRLPDHIEWKAAFGLILTLVWLYIEFLRIIAIVFGRR